MPTTSHQTVRPGCSLCGRRIGEGEIHSICTLRDIYVCELCFDGLAVEFIGHDSYGDPCNWYDDRALLPRTRDAAIERLLDPLIVRSSYQHFLDGNLREAALNAITAIFDLIRERTGLKSDGTRLVEEALSLERPRLIVSELKTDSGRSEQSGVLNMLKGAYLSIRNPRAHTLAHDLTRLEVVRYLIFASVLAERISEAQKV